MVRGGKWTGARGRRRQRRLRGPLLLPWARLIPLRLLPPRGARRALGRLPLRGSRGHRGRGGPRQVRSGAQRRENGSAPRVAPGTRGPAAPAPVGPGSRSQPGRPSPIGLLLLTALPARRPLKGKREGETARVKKESALPGRAAGANRRGRDVDPALRLPRPPSPAHRAPPRLGSKPEKSRSSPHAPPTLAQLRTFRRMKEGPPGVRAYPRALVRGCRRGLMLFMHLINIAAALRFVGSSVACGAHPHSFLGHLF